MVGPCPHFATYLPNFCTPDFTFLVQCTVSSRPKRAKSHSSNQTYTLNWTSAFTMLNGSTTWALSKKNERKDAPEYQRPLVRAPLYALPHVSIVHMHLRSTIGVSHMPMDNNAGSAHPSWKFQIYLTSLAQSNKLLKRPHNREIHSCAIQKG